ncbi:hypothetical protein JYB62_18575 [Algoriphagus lutimaris]|uniref:hypothetical protein n=1 Tax=Algoriphagus lutimaris TaxID=613197 RepID=UPI00196A8903|nr:hypothetical protein [Algoriphagus lutimaris]MBN3522016.1 hypothetical protein [Algoriphagus lutimaris]
MKNFSIIFSCLFLLIVSGCEMSNEEGLTSDPTMMKSTNILNTVDFDGNIKQVPIQPTSQSKKASGIQSRRAEVMVNGHMEYFANDSENTWKKSLNASGNATSGKGQVEIKSNFWGDVHGTVLCTYAEGNEVVVAMFITDSKEDLNAWYQDNTVVWFRLTDNGEGNGATPDQHYNTIWYYPGAFDTIEDAQDVIANNFTCQDLFGYGWGTPVDIKEGNFQIK